MGKIYTVEEECLVSKDITDVPYSSDVDYRNFSNAFKDSSASYKMYWLLSILDEVLMGNNEITFKRLICRMISKAWYPISKCKLNFGYCDNLGKVVNYILNKYDKTLSYSEKEILDYLEDCLENGDDKELIKMIRELTYNVPYRFLAPFFRDNTKGKKKQTDRIIEELSKSDSKCVYSIWGNKWNDKIIKISDKWYMYLKYNYKILKGWTFYNLVCFLQKRNPNVPAISMKLKAPESRNLTTAKEIWTGVIETRHVQDIYTGLDFTKENYKEHGVLSIDHFIPWSFVLHDQMWNLVPTFKNINSSKSDNLVSYEEYIDKFCRVQYEAFCYVLEKKKSNAIEEYRDVLKMSDIERLYVRENEGEFLKRIEGVIKPVYEIAKGQGF